MIFENVVVDGKKVEVEVRIITRILLKLPEGKSRKVGTRLLENPKFPRSFLTSVQSCSDGLIIEGDTPVGCSRIVVARDACDRLNKLLASSSPNTRGGGGNSGSDG